MTPAPAPMPVPATASRLIDPQSLQEVDKQGVYRKSLLILLVHHEPYQAEETKEDHILSEAD